MKNFSRIKIVVLCAVESPYAQAHAQRFRRAGEFFRYVKYSEAILDRELNKVHQKFGTLG